MWLLRTDPAPDVLRRNVRLVGQLLHGRGDWRWLEEGDADGAEAVSTSGEEAAAEDGLDAGAGATRGGAPAPRHCVIKARE